MSEQIADKGATKGLQCTLPRGDTVAGFMSSETSFYWVFKNTKGDVTRIRLSLDAVRAMGQITEQLLDPTEESA